MEKNLITVVVPVYNAEKTINRCVDSILNQSCSNLELLLIDDGSTDGSGELCRKYARKDKRVRYFYQENRGVSAARNQGIDLAQGEYVSFVDSDDWLELNALEALFEAVNKYDADCVLPRMKGIYYSADGEYLKDVFHNDAFDCVIHAGELPSEFEKLFRSWACFSTCGRLYRVEALNRHNIRFEPKVRVLEDFCFNLDAFVWFNTIVHIDVVAYNYSVLGIEKYQFKRSYRATMDGTKAAYNKLSTFLKAREMPFEEPYANLFISYWIQTIRVIQQIDIPAGERIRALKEIANEVKTEQLLKHCNPAAVDTQYKVLFRTCSVILFNIVQYLKEIKYRIKCALRRAVL